MRTDETTTPMPTPAAGPTPNSIWNAILTGIATAIIGLLSWIARMLGRVGPIEAEQNRMARSLAQVRDHQDAADAIQGRHDTEIEVLKAQQGQLMDTATTTQHMVTEIYSYLIKPH